MTVAASTVEVRTYRPTDRAAVLRMLTETMAGGPTGERTADFFEWKHTHNPFGRSLALVAEADGDVVGFRTFMRWRFIRGGRPLHAVRAVDTATHPDHQGRGIFTQLTRAAISAAGDDGVDLIFNTPNTNSLPGYLKLGWRPVGKVPIAVRIVRPRRFAARIRHRAAPAPPGRPVVDLPPAATVLDDLGAVQDLLDTADQPGDRLRTDRDAAFLHWRYARAPGLDYRVLAAHDGGRLRGLAIARPRWRGRLAELTLAEVIVPHRDTKIARRLLSGVAATGVDHVATHLRGWPTADRARRRTGYVAWPGQTMTLVARTVDAGDVAVDTDLGDWALSLGDLEVF